jgi:ferric-dicitrate binding protein FerR (iron transport regulator)
LSPGEELLAPKDQRSFSRQQFNYESTFGWKEGILLFDGADFAGFRSAIEKWYGVKVEIRGTPPVDWQIRARYQHEDLRHVLRDICFNKSIKFELHDKNVLITF